MQRTLPAGANDRSLMTSGFTLLEMICVLAIIAILVAILLPAIPSSTSQPRLQAYAIQITSLLIADRNAAIRSRHPIITNVDTLARSIHSGATGQTIQLPEDVNFTTTLATQCNGRPSSAAVVFFASGLSCGGVLSLLHGGAGYEIRVNWLTGGVEIVRRQIL